MCALLSPRDVGDILPAGVLKFFLNKPGGCFFKKNTTVATGLQKLRNMVEVQPIGAVLSWTCPGCGVTTFGAHSITVSAFCCCVCFLFWYLLACFFCLCFVVFFSVFYFYVFGSATKRVLGQEAVHVLQTQTRRRGLSSARRLTRRT